MSRFEESLQTLLKALKAAGQLEPYGQRIRAWVNKFDAQLKFSPEIVDYNVCFDLLALLLTEEALTSDVAYLFRPLLIELAVRATLLKMDCSTFSRIEALVGMFATLLPGSPQLKGVFVDFTRGSPSPLDQFNFDQGTLDAYLSDKAVATTVSRNLFAMLRLLMTDSSLFKHWNLGPLFILVRAKNVQVAAVAFQCLLIYSGIDEKRARMLVEEDVYVASQMIVVQLLEMQPRGVLNCPDPLSGWELSHFTSSLTAKVVNVGDVLLFKSNQGSSEPSKLVPVATTFKNLQAIALALSMGAPVLLEGETGVGKTALIEEVARAVSKMDMVKIHLGDQTDSKALLGTYVATPTPGQFQWQMGVLTRAVKFGRWVLIEDIDLAPQEVIAVIIPLLESRTLFIPGRGEKIVAADGFQLFATRRTLAPSRAGAAGPDRQLAGGSFWTKVTVNPLSSDELRQVVSQRFPGLAALAPPILKVFSTMQQAYLRPETLKISAIRIGRPLTTRDLIKWCTRVAKLAPLQLPLQEETRECFFSEAVDSFCGMLADFDTWAKVLAVLGEALGMSPMKVRYYTTSHAPIFEDGHDAVIRIGRVQLTRPSSALELQLVKPNCAQPFAPTKHALRLMERIAACVQLTEPVLLVGETGTGKTTVVQHLARLMNQKLVAFNLSQQSDSSDLLGGFKPVDGKALAFPLLEKFLDLFCATFNAEQNQAFTVKARKFFTRSKWPKLVEMFKVAIVKAAQTTQPHGPLSKLPRIKGRGLAREWEQFSKEVASFEAQADKLDNKLLFNFIEGTLVKAVRQGHWVLLDEINLATTETLECLSGLLQDKHGSLLLTEKGDAEEIPRHPNFRVFACMNPATDVGKRDLPPGLRNRFTEFYVHSPDTAQEDLVAIVKGYLSGLVHGDESAVMDVVGFYQAVKALQRARRIADGANQTPHYSIRTLARALAHVRHTVTVYGLRRALYEGFCMTFATQLTREGCHTITELIKSHLLCPVRDIAQCLSFVPPPEAGGDFVQFRKGSFWLPRGPEPIDPQAHARYVITPSVQENIDKLARVVMSGRYPVLIQGPTSSGKTSMVEYLANCTGHRFVRINNHEHTDLQEYVGSYVSKDGRLQFQEGALVTALRHGHWIVLDELNLAPSDVLEALNRLLDDNRELFISETQEVVKPHNNFMLFATQNPAGLYGGRKALSRAFRNRFLELHFDDIPGAELETILTTRCALAPSYCKLMIQVYAKLQAHRQTSRVFESKEGFITLRDLFRWANRQAAGKLELANHGYMLLAERVRKPEEKLIVKATLEEVIKVKIDTDALYACDPLPEFQASAAGMPITWTKAMRRLFSLVAACLRNREPVLLVGSTGCGKTTVCQMLAAASNQTLRIVNCHQNTETSDLLGGQRPLRQQAALRSQLHQDLLRVLSPILGSECPSELNGLCSTFESLYRSKPNSSLWKSAKEGGLDNAILDGLLVRAHQASNLFEWHDGPLVQSMKEGAMFLLDEISLAEDSVLERLNSVLEPSRLLVLAEKGSERVEQLTADAKFQFLATMNPGGDFGKKELSPALRNRFTEIWVPPVSDSGDLRCIIEGGLSALPTEARSRLATAILAFVGWFVAAVSPKASNESRQVVSLRDILSWTHFIVKTYTALEDEALAFVHGGCLVFLDGLGSNASPAASSVNDPRRADQLRHRGLERLMHLSGQVYDARDFYLGRGNVEEAICYTQAQVQDLPSAFKVGPFSIAKGPAVVKRDAFALHAPTPFDNVRRVLRALQISKPVMLEGSPGVGKTSLVQAIADRACRTLVRINLSEQTDLMDLFGTDLPVEGGRSGEFAWRDAPFLSAMRRGHWVLLDEINLASQSVLEGLNSCLDHRGSVFVPELGRTFDKAPEFQVFAAQNPLQQGGGRKGLPQSFLNRFAQVHIQPLGRGDLQVICRQAYPHLPPAIIAKMLEFNHRLHEATMIQCRFGRQGSPWEFNLRDVFRWMDLLRTPLTQPQDFLDLVYLQRMRTLEDRCQVVQLFRAVFGTPCDLPNPDYRLDAEALWVGHSRLARVTGPHPVGDGFQWLQSQLPALEAVMRCIEMNWPAILVGPQGSGKTSLLRGLAKLVGRPLVEFAMNPGVDTMELLGGFEQVEPARYRQVAKTKLLALLDRLSARCFAAKSEQPPSASRLGQVADMRRRLQHLDWDQSNALLLRPILDQLILLAADDTAVHQAIQDAQQAVAALANLEGSETGGRFEWVEGALIEAMEDGSWFLIDNANLCHASVLDRLNSLMEPNGALMLHERGMGADGEMRWARPHKDFRILLAVDPAHGELSRPMRNRGLEIVLPLAADWSANPYDLHRVVAINNFSLTQATQLIQSHHSALSSEGGTLTLTPGAPRDFSFLCRWVAERVQRGATFAAALEAGIRTVYRRGVDVKSPLGFPWIIPAASTSLLARDTALFTLLSQAGSLVDLLSHPNDDPSLWAEQVESAGLYFVLRVTPHDAELRGRFLAWLESRVGPNTQVAALRHILSALIRCPVIGELRGICSAFCGERLQCEFPDTMSPMDWVGSQAFYEAMLRCSSHLVQRFHALLSKFQVSALLFKVDFQLSRAIRHAESRMGNVSLLEQSYLAAQHGTTPEGPYGTLIQQFYPLIVAIQAYLTHWTLPTTDGVVDEATITALVSHLASLLTTLDSEQVEFARLASLTKWIAKALKGDTSLVSKAVAAAADRILQMIGQSGHRAMKLIWKYLRYPVLRTVALQLLKVEWAGALARIDPYRSYGQLAFDPYTSSQRRAIPSVVQALATPHLLEPNTSAFQAAVDSACTIVSDAVAELEAHAAHSSTYDDLITRSFAAMDHASLAQESHLLAQVIAAANGYNPNLISHQSVQAWLQTSFQTSSRSVADFAAWQNIVWLLERRPLDQAMLRGFLTDQLLAWSQRLWHGSFNYLSTRSGALDTSAGPPRLYQSLKTVATLQLLASLDAFPLQSLRRHTHLIEKLSGTLHEQLGDTSLMDQSGLQIAVGLLTQMIFSFAKQLPSDQVNAIHNLCHALTLQLGTLSSGHWLLAPESRRRALALSRATNLVTELKTQLDAITHLILRGAICTYLGPALSLMHDFLLHFDQSPYGVYGRIWVYIGLGFLHTYIPSYPYDPVIKAQMKRELYQGKALQLQAALSVHQAIQRNYNGAQSNPYISQLEAAHLETRAGLDKLGALVIPRPETSQVAELFQEITYLQAKLLDPQALLSLMEDFEIGAGEVAVAKERNLQSNLEEFARRLQVKYPLYPDILRPIELALHTLRHGLRLCVYGSQKSEAPYLERFLEALLAYPYRVDPGRSFMDAVSIGPALCQLKGQFTAQLTPSKATAYGNLLVILAQRFAVEVANRGWVSPSDRTHLQAIFSEIGTLWNRVDECRRRELKEKEAQFRNKVQTTENIEDDDAALLEKEMRELFPTYEEDFGQPSVTPAAPTGSFKEVDAEWANEVAALHALLADWLHRARVAPQPATHPQKEHLLMRSYTAGANLLHAVSRMPDWRLDVQLASSRALALHLGWERLSNPLRSSARAETLIDAPPYNFYHSPNTGEAQKLVPLLSQLQQRVAELLEQWPEHAVLAELQMTLQRIAQFSGESPLVKLLTGLEMLLRKAQDWEAYAGRQYSLSEPLKEVTSLIVRWRQLELGSWPTLLDSILASFATAAHTWWLDLYNAILATSADDQGKLVDTLNALDRFMRSSTLGEFGPRLTMLRSFSLHLKALAADGLEPTVNLHRIVSNLYDYYQQFAAPAKDKVAAYRKPIEAELKGLVKVASWKDVNVDALHQSAMKSHRALGRLARKFRTHLTTPIVTVLTEVQTNVTEPSSKSPSLEVDGSTHSDLILPDHGLSLWPHPDTGIMARFTKLYRTEVYLMNRSPRASPRPLEHLSSEVLGQIQEFQAEAVPEDKAERVAFIKTRRMVKRKALGDLWKQLKFIGLKYRSSVRRELAPAAIFQHPVLAPFDDAWSFAQRQIDPHFGQLYSGNPDWDKAQFYYQRILARVPHLKQCAHQPSPDLSPAETERGLGYVEGMLQLAQQQRVALGTAYPHLAAVSGILANWAQAAGTPSMALSISAFHQLQADKAILDTTFEWLGQALRVLSVQRGPDTLSARLQPILSKVQALQTATNFEVSKVLALPLACGITDFIPGPSAVETCRVNARALTDAHVELSALLSQHRERAALLAPLVDHLGLHLKRAHPEPITDGAFVRQHAADIETLARRLIEAIQVSTQKLVKQSRVVRECSEDAADRFGMHPNQLALAHRHYLSVIGWLDLPGIAALASEVQSHLHQLSRAEYPAACPGILEVAPLLHQHFLMARQMVWEFIASHKALCKLNYILCNLAITLFQRGFCLPPPDPEEGPGIDGQTGTGIGEGEGDKDVSEAIESEDQVAGTQNEPKSEHDQSQDEKDKAFEMEQEFDGEMEDVDHDESEADSNSEAEDFDDEVAPLGDEEAVDEKIWGDDNEDPAEAQAGKDIQNQMSQDDEIVAKEADDRPSNQPTPEPHTADEPKGEDQPQEDGDQEFEEQPENTSSKDKPTEVPEGDHLDLPEDLELDLDDDAQTGMGDEDDLAPESNDEEQDAMDVDPAEDSQSQDPNDGADLAEDSQSHGQDVDADSAEDSQGQAPDDTDDPTRAATDQDPSPNEDKMQAEARGAELPRKQPEVTPTASDAPQNQNGAPPPTSNETMGVAGPSGQAAVDSCGQPAPEEDSHKPAGVEQPSQPGHPPPPSSNESAPIHDTQEQEEPMDDGRINPHRALAEALNQWRQRLDAADPATEEMELPKDDLEPPLPIDDAANQRLEYVAKDDQAHDAEALGAATEEQFKKSIAIPDASDADPAPDRADAHEPMAEDANPISDWHLTENVHDGLHDQENLHPTGLRAGDTMDATEDAVEAPAAEVDVEALRRELEQQLAVWCQQQDGDKAQNSRELWMRYEHLTHDLALNLCEQLRLILEPTLATKLQGDYRTGKRLNMRKMIPYIASQFKKDKIWLRRTKPSQRQYQVMIAVDDSKSMSESHSVQLTFESLALVTRALHQLEVGSTSVVSFGERVKILHPFEAPFTQESGAYLINQFTFAQTKTNLGALLQTTLQLFEHAGHRAGRADLWQLQLILSDGLCEDHEGLRAYLRLAEEQRIMVIFIIMDTKAQGAHSILNLQQVSYAPNAAGAQAMRLTRYISTFPFRYYLILNHVHLLPHVLADTLRQYFQLAQG
ncbi:AAA ATPase midasin [Massospora cicadina]|nr:AAA ATPase midasin [Massospora cicadina]